MADHTEPPEKSAIIKDLESVHDALQPNPPPKSPDTEPDHAQHRRQEPTSEDLDDVPLLDDIVPTPELEAASELHYARPGLTRDMFSSLLGDTWQQLPGARGRKPHLTGEMRSVLDAVTRRWLDDLVVAHLDELHDLIMQTLSDHSLDTTDETPDGQ